MFCAVYYVYDSMGDVVFKRQSSSITKKVSQVE